MTADGRSAADGPATGTPTVSVVVPSRNRAGLLARLVGALGRQEHVGSFEVLVVDDCSTDHTWTELQRLRSTAPFPLRPHRLASRSGPAAARNRGWRAAAAPLIAFTDDDCVPDGCWLATLVDGLGRYDMVQGATRPDPVQADRTGPFSRTLDVRSEDGFYQTCNMGYRRRVLEALDGFDERFRHPTGEDTDLAWRAKEGGATSAFLPDAVVFHDVRASSFRAHLADVGRWEGVVLAVRRHPGLRARFHRRWFWKPSHPPALAAAAGLIAMIRPGPPVHRLVPAAALVLPYVRYRTTVLPLRGGPRRRVAAMPLALVADLAEVGVLARASVRYRTLLL